MARLFFDSPRIFPIVDSCLQSTIVRSKSTQILRGNHTTHTRKSSVGFVITVTHPNNNLIRRTLFTHWHVMTLLKKHSTHIQSINWWSRIWLAARNGRINRNGWESDTRGNMWLSQVELLSQRANLVLLSSCLLAAPWQDPPSALKYFETAELLTESDWRKFGF
jgi:hypothetical protein